MSGILLIATFVFLFFFGYRMTGLLDHFLDTNRFQPEEGLENIIPNDGLSGQELPDYSAAHRAS